MTNKQAMLWIEQLLISVCYLIQAKCSLSEQPEPDGEIDTAIDKISTVISQIKREYNIVGFEPERCREEVK